MVLRLLALTIWTLRIVALLSGVTVAVTLLLVVILAGHDDSDSR